MGVSRPPTRYILRKAMQLGQKMALKERRLKPRIAGAYQYTSYSLFRTVHRHQITELDAFAPWDAKLQRLIEREANGARVDMSSPRRWEAFYAQVAAPIISTFWYACEQVWQLEKLYDQEVETFQKKLAQHQVLHVYCPDVAQKQAGQSLDADEQAHWDRVASTLFEEMSGDTDESLWELPQADSPFARRTEASPAK